MSYKALYINHGDIYLSYFQMKNHDSTWYLKWIMDVAIREMKK